MNVTHRCAVHFNSLLRLRQQLVPIQLGGTWIVLLLCIGCGAIVLTEELSGLGVAAQLHLTQLNPCPVYIQVRRSHKRQVHTQVTVHSGAINAYEHAIRNRRPRRIFGTAIETRLHNDKQEWNLVTWYCWNVTKVHEWRSLAGIMHFE